jgi:hypothetical protein
MVAITFCFVAPALAQTLPLRPLKRMFGVGDDEFFKGAWIKVRPGTEMADSNLWWEQARQIWQLADTLGFNILHVQAEDLNLHVTDSLLRQRTRTDQRLIVTHYGDNFAQLSVGREIRFYPFTGLDSVEYKFWEAKFMTMAGGTTEISPSEVDVYDQPAKEQHYRQISMSGPTVVARDIVFDQFPARIYRWPADSLAGSPGKVQNTDEFLADKLQFNRNATRQFVVVTGHLFEDDSSTTLPGDSILKVEVIYEIPTRHTFMVYDSVNNSTTAHIDTVNTIERSLATFYVTKQDLAPAISESYDKYHEVPLSFDARWCSDSSFSRDRDRMRFHRGDRTGNCAGESIALP